MARECSFYYYDGGYSCELKRKKEGYSSIDSDTVHRYCWDYHYEECPRYRNRQSSSKECSFYYYDSGYSCELRRKKEGYSSIDSDTVHRYCWGSRYDECPRYRDDQSSGGCFLTSACVEAKGLPDNCYELTTLRNFRDKYLAAQDCGKCEIAHYYHMAPTIVARIKSSPNASAVFEKIYEELVAPCVKLIEQGALDSAHAKYREYVIMLEKKEVFNDGTI